jgi:hypothetical protein
MAEALAIGASIIAVIQITKTLVELTARRHAAFVNRRIPCEKFVSFKDRLSQLLFLAEDVNRRDTAGARRSEYSKMEESLQKCESFLEEYDSGGAVQRLLGFSPNEMTLEWHHRVIDYCFEALQQQSLSRIEDKL